MSIAIRSAELFCFFSLVVHLASISIAARRCRADRREHAPPPDASPISLIRPVCGIDNYCEETLRTTFELDYPRYEIIFCAAQGFDPVIPVLERLMAAHPRVNSKLLIGDDRISANPKLNNIVKGWKAAAFNWIIIADSNVLMPRDYVQRLLAAWRPGTGLVCSPPVGYRPRNLSAELECAFLNTHEARWQYVADTLGLGFAQGKSMLWLREVLERAGGIEALADEMAEDAAATKVVRRLGLRVRLVDGPFAQPLGIRKLSDVWFRQVRWARLRRASFTACFAAEIFAGGLFPLALCAAAVGSSTAAPWAALMAFAAVWYGAEMLLIGAAGWHLSSRTLLACILRDLLLPVLWIQAWLGSTLRWRDNRMRLPRARLAN